MRKKPETLSEPSAADELIDGVFVPDEPPADVAADLDRFHRLCASGELADLLAKIAGLDPESSATRH
jgi:hypothetical protein